MHTRLATATLTLVAAATLVGCGGREARKDPTPPTTTVTPSTAAPSTTSPPSTTTIAASTTVSATTAAPTTTAPLPTVAPVAPTTALDTKAIDAALRDLDAVLGDLDNSVDNPQGDQS